MEHKLFDGELKVMEILWEQGETSAKDIAAILKDRAGWSKTTTYTVIKRCMEKEALARTDPGFLCRALIRREDVQRRETDALVRRMYGGHPERLAEMLLNRLTPEEIEALRRKARS